MLLIIKTPQKGCQQRWWRQVRAKQMRAGLRDGPGLDENAHGEKLRAEAAGFQAEP
jgi:hypothetical protein